jgi:hypothetical protein
MSGVMIGKPNASPLATAWSPTPGTRAALLGGVLLLALALRLAAVFADYPFSYYGDELHFIKRAMALGTGDLNPHWFHKPALLMYLLLFCYGCYFVLGYVAGLFGSVDQFGAHFLTNMGPFLVIGRCLVVAFGVGTVYVVQRIAVRVHGSFLHGLTAALAVAVVYPAVVGSQSVKADVPAGFFVALSFLIYLRSRERDAMGPTAVASLLAGAAMGTKYYGVILLPGYAVMEWFGGLRCGRSWKSVLGRSAAVCALFVLGFFLTSPYNFLDPTWGRGFLGSMLERTGLEEATAVFDPDNDIVYVPGLGSTVVAIGHLARRAIDPKALGTVFVVLAAAGLVAGALDKRTRPYATYLVFPLLAFVFLSAWWSSFHINWRHFNAVVPLVCTLIFPGALFLARLVRVPRRWCVVVALALVLGPAIRHLYSDVRYDWELFKPDTRTAAYRWIVENVDPRARMLLDEYGPILQPNPESVRRQRQRLEGLPAEEAFTSHHAPRLELLERFPSAAAKNFDELAHPWWLNRELSDAELRQGWGHRDASNPMKLRVPKTVEVYRAERFRYVVTNSEAQKRYFASAKSEQAFPSFVRLYRDLQRLRPVRTFDPADL